MGVEPPFLYEDHPSKYSFLGPTEKGFNPKAVSQASWFPPKPKAKIEGPLINAKEFNRHPDSYFSVPYGNLNRKPVRPRTKSQVKWTRYVQLSLRICELSAAVGMLFCIICIKKIDASTGWIIRVPPGIIILHTIYAIYHLARSSKGRTPSSSASYMIFAAIIDVGLIPFLVFTALISHTQSIEPVNVTGHWTTLFGSDEAIMKITYSTFLISVVGGSLHLVSLIISIYLGVIFRTISRLPPDMNPLEDNLTSRHKRNKSSLMDSRASQRDSTVTDGNRESSVDDPLISLPRTVPFMHTRNHSRHDNIDSLRQTPSATVSRTDLPTIPFYDQPPAHRSSHTNIKGPFYTHTAASRPSPETETATGNIHRSPTRSSSIYSTSTISTIATDHPGFSRSRSTAPSLPDSNWITHPSSSPSPLPSPPRELKHLRNEPPSYQPLSQTAPFEYIFNDENNFPKPLEMNPPTPPIQKQQQRHAIGNRALTPGTGNVGQGGWATGPGMVGIGKARAWGGMGRPGTSTMGAGGRVVSRSGVEVQQGGILPSGGMRAREVSGRVMEEGRGGTREWM